MALGFSNVAAPLNLRSHFSAVETEGKNEPFLGQKAARASARSTAARGDRLVARFRCYGDSDPSWKAASSKQDDSNSSERSARASIPQRPAYHCDTGDHQGPGRRFGSTRDLKPDLARTISRRKRKGSR